MLQGGGDKGSGLRKGRRERKTLGLGAWGNIHTVYTSKSKPWGILSRAYGQDAKTKVQLEVATQEHTTFRAMLP